MHRHRKLKTSKAEGQQTMDGQGEENVESPQQQQQTQDEERKVIVGQIELSPFNGNNDNHQNSHDDEYSSAGENDENGQNELNWSMQSVISRSMRRSNRIMLESTEKLNDGGRET